MTTQTAADTVPDTSCSCCGAPYTGDDDRGIELHFWSNHDVDLRTNDVACYVRFESARFAWVLPDEWAGLELAPGRLHAPQATDYGLLEFGLVDPHGNLVRIGGRLDGAA